MTFKTCFVEQSILAHTAVPSLHVPSRIRLIEHGLNWINHILHAGTQGPLNRLDYKAAKYLAVVGGTVSNLKPGRVINPWVSVTDCCHTAFLISGMLFGYRSHLRSLDLHMCTKPTLSLLSL